MLEQFRIEAELELLSPLHMGTGEFELRSKLLHEKPPSDEPDPLVALVVRDERGLPCLPATAIKGCLRAACLAAGWEEENRDLLFGQIIHHEKDLGRMGQAIFRMGRLNKSEVPQALGLPHYNPKRASYIQTRHRRDQDSGTVAEGALFYQEMVPAGCRFALRATFLGNREELEDLLLPALAHLARPDGVSLGKGYSLGQGRLRLILEDGKLTVQHTFFNPEEFEKDSLEIKLALPPADATTIPRWRLRLSCRGPFLSHDPDRPQAQEDLEAGRNNILRPLVTGDGQPILPTSGLMGALKSRCGWLCQLKGDKGGDDPTRVLAPEEEPSTLTTTERLFGVTGWRGLVRVESLEFMPAGPPIKIPQVALDRFTSGPIDQALFFTEAYLDVELEAVLTLEARDGYGGPGSPEHKAFQDLLDDLTAQDEILPLGHGVTNGFGWFTVQTLALEETEHA